MNIIKREPFTTRLSKDVIIIYKKDKTSSRAPYDLTSLENYLRSILELESFTINGSERYKDYKDFLNKTKKSEPISPKSKPLF